MVEHLPQLARHQWGELPRVGLEHVGLLVLDALADHRLRRHAHADGPDLQEPPRRASLTGGLEERFRALTRRAKKRPDRSLRRIETVIPLQVNVAGFTELRLQVGRHRDLREPDGEGPRVRFDERLTPW